MTLAFSKYPGHIVNVQQMSKTFSKCPGHLVNVHIHFYKYPSKIVFMKSWVLTQMALHTEAN